MLPPGVSGALRCETPSGTWNVCEDEVLLGAVVLEVGAVDNVTLDAAGTNTVAQSESSVCSSD